MTARTYRFPFSVIDASMGESSSLPFLPLTLTHRGVSVPVSGLLDTGASVNVLPYDVGKRLGAVWDQQTVPVRLTGNLAQLGARVLVVTATIDSFEPVRLAFAWTQAENVPLILGQVDFFLEYDVCFFRSQQAFEITPKE